MKHLLVSVVIPVYNMEAHILRAAESVLWQPRADFLELLLVDDGSKDKSGMICDQIALTYHSFRSVRVFHKENGGLSDARNYGLERIKGEYVTFVDSDDYVGPDYLRILYEMIQEDGCDVSIVRFKEVSCEDLRCYRKPGSKVSPLIFMNSIGTLGGGNHFIEVDKDDDDSLYLVIHTGSRRSGKDVAEYYQQAAFDRLNVSGRVYQEKVRQERDKMIAEMKRSGRARDIEKVLKTWTPDTVQPMDPVPYEFAYCEGDLFDDYISDMKIMQNYARLNRETIAKIILENMGLHADDMFHTVHNYIDMESMILRKGSVSAKAGEILLIPMNMRDGSLLCVGKGNPDWNCSAPHGAGRLMSRSEAKASVGMDEFRKSMEGIYTTSVSRDTIDESPMAYKPMDEIVKNISDTAEIRTVIRPVYNFKAGGE